MGRDQPSRPQLVELVTKLIVELVAEWRAELVLELIAVEGIRCNERWGNDEVWRTVEIAKIRFVTAAPTHFVVVEMKGIRPLKAARLNAGRFDSGSYRAMLVWFVLRRMPIDPRIVWAAISVTLISLVLFVGRCETGQNGDYREE